MLFFAAGSVVTTSSGLASLTSWPSDSCHSRCIEINKIYILNPTAVAKLLQYSGSKVEHRDGFSSYK